VCGCANYPISVDPQNVRASIRSTLGARRDRCASNSGGRSTSSFAVDRNGSQQEQSCDGFLAYERMLEAHPELTGDVPLLGIPAAEPADIDDYRAYLAACYALRRASIANTVAAAGHRFAWRSKDNIGASDRGNSQLSTSCWSNPIYDGMNLVAKEGRLSISADGVLVLQRERGLTRGARRMGDHRQSHSNIDETAEALYLGLDHGRRARRRLDRPRFATWCEPMTSRDGYHCSFRTSAS